MAEYNEIMEDVRAIESGIRSLVMRVHVEYNTKARYLHLFETEYIPISENNPEMALKFMDKAYNLTNDQKSYIRKNHDGFNVASA